MQLDDIRILLSIIVSIISIIRETPHNSPSKKRIKEKRPAKQQIA